MSVRIKQESISLERVAYFLIILVIACYVLIVAQDILVPLAFAIFLAFMAKPICTWFEAGISSRVLSILLCFFVLIIPVALVLTLFSFQSVEVFSDLGGISTRLRDGLNSILNWGLDRFNVSRSAGTEWVQENLGGAVQGPLDLVTSGIGTSTTVLANLFLTFIYTFLILLYRTSFKNFFLSQFPPSKRDTGVEFINEVQDVTQQYLYGLGLVMVILGVLNSAGLWLIGLEYALFWGFLAAFLAVIPYVGTFIGGLLPFLYALVTAETWWQPLAVVILFATVQAIEGNVITPKVVGSSVRVNPLAAILGLFIGGAMWGVSGLILAIPVVAILRVTFDNIDATKPLALLMSDDLYEHKDDFLEDFNRGRFRLTALFRKDKPLVKVETEKKKKGPKIIIPGEHSVTSDTSNPGES